MKYTATIDSGSRQEFNNDTQRGLAQPPNSLVDEPDVDPFPAASEICERPIDRSKAPVDLSDIPIISIDKIRYTRARIWGDSRCRAGVINPLRTIANDVPEHR